MIEYTTDGNKWTKVTANKVFDDLHTAKRENDSKVLLKSYGSVNAVRIVSKYGSFEFDDSNYHSVYVYLRVDLGIITILTNGMDVTIDL